jgi:hypothetical protein
MSEEKISVVDIIMKAHRESKGEFVDLVVEHGELAGIKVGHLIWWGKHMKDPGLYKLWHPQDHISHRAETITDNNGKTTVILIA